MSSHDLKRFDVIIVERNTYRTPVFADGPEEACEKAAALFGADQIERERELIDTTFETAAAKEIPPPDLLRCRRCKGDISWSSTPGYSYACPECDEDLYNVEVERKPDVEPKNRYL